MSDPLANFNFGSSGSGLFLSEFPARLRVLTTDPVVHMDEKYGTTKFAFVVWNHNLGKAQILDRGSSIAKAIQELHNDEDYGADIQKIDIKITSSGEGKETRYTVTPLPRPLDLTNDQIKEAAAIDLMAHVKNGVRMSEAIQHPERVKLKQADALNEANDIDDDISGSEPVELSAIPF